MPRYKLFLKTVEVRSCIVEFPDTVALKEYLEQYDVPDGVFHMQESFRTELEWENNYGTRDVVVLPGQET